jgi:CPA1 family monovalent cation:H+ antiporter
MVNVPLLLRSLHFIPLTLTIVYLARALSVFVTTPRLSRAYRLVLVWGGLRGGLALGLVLTLPATFPHRDLFIALAIAVVFSTLFINALTTRKVLSVLKLDKLTPAEKSLFARTIELIREAAFRPLTSAAAQGALSEQLVMEHEKKFSAWFEKSMPESLLDRAVDIRFRTSSMLLKERKYYDQRLQEGALSKEAYLDLVASVLQRLEAFNVGRLEALKAYQLEFTERRPLFEQFWAFLGRGHEIFLHRLTTRLETLLHLRFAIEESAAGIADREILEINGAWRGSADSYLQEFYKNYPHYSGIVQARVISTAVRARSERTLRELFELGVISPGVFAKASSMIASEFEISMHEANQLVRPSPAYLLARIPLIKSLPLPRVAIRTLADSMKRQVLHSGERLCKKGEPGDSLYLVLAGTLETEEKARLLTGDFTGEDCLLKNAPRAHTLVSSGTTEVLELKQNVFKRVLDDYPTLKNQLYTG